MDKPRVITPERAKIKVFLDRHTIFRMCEAPWEALVSNKTLTFMIDPEDLESINDDDGS